MKKSLSYLITIMRDYGPALAVAIGLTYASIHYRSELKQWFAYHPIHDQSGEADGTHGISTKTMDNDIAYYTCSMHPSVKSQTPGKCPICSMTLLPITHKELNAGQITIDNQRRQLLGIKTGVIEKRAFTKTVRAPGTLVYDETGYTDISLKFSGWIEELFADSTGQQITLGQPLFSIYSPELLTAQEELLNASRLFTQTPHLGEPLLAAAKRRLSLWDVTADQIQGIITNNAPSRHLTYAAPVSGVITEKKIVKGSHIDAGEWLYRVADLSHIWLEANIYEADLPLLQTGQTAQITLPYFPGSTFSGTIAYIYPWMNAATRTGKVRFLLENKDGKLKPEMLATVTISIPLGVKMVVPETAILPTGEAEIVFVDLGEGRFAPRKIKTGIKSQNYYEILEGLEAGEMVVIGGNFLIASESKLKSGVDKW